MPDFLLCMQLYDRFRGTHIHIHMKTEIATNIRLGIFFPSEGNDQIKK